MKSIKLLAAVAALTASSAAMAGAPWTYVDLGYVVADSIDANIGGQSLDLESDAISLRGSFGFGEIFHVGATFADGDVLGGKSDTGLGADLTTYGVYFGVNPAITENMDLVARIGYNVADADFGAPDDAEYDAITLLTGPRMMITEKLELSAYVSYTAGNLDLENNSGVDADFTDIGYQIGGAYYFTPMFSLGVDVTTGLLDVANIYARVSF